MRKYLEILKNCTLFNGISDDDLFKMLHCLGAKIITFDKKYTVLAEGSPAKYIGIVLSGSVHIIQVDYEGNRSIIEEIHPSEIFAEEFACAESDCIPITAIANEPSDVMFIDCSHIIHTCSNSCGFHQRLIFNLMKNLASKAIMFHQKLEITSKRTTREKLMTYLNIQSKRCGSHSFDIPFDRQELADYLEVERSGLSTEIGKLKSEGIIDNTKRHFTLL